MQVAVYVLALEWLADGRFRAVLAAAFEGTWSVGVMTLALTTWLARDWRYIQLCIALPTIVALTYTWYAKMFFIFRVRGLEVRRLDTLFKINENFLKLRCL